MDYFIFNKTETESNKNDFLDYDHQYVDTLQKQLHLMKEQFLIQQNDIIQKLEIYKNGIISYRNCLSQIEENIKNRPIIKKKYKIKIKSKFYHKLLFFENLIQYILKNIKYYNSEEFKFFFEDKILVLNTNLNSEIVKFKNYFTKNHMTEQKK